MSNKKRPPFDVYWVIDQPIADVKKRELLFITAKAAGFEVHTPDWDHEKVSSYPLVGGDPAGGIFQTYKGFLDKCMTYEYVMEELTKIIKYETAIQETTNST